MALQEKVDMLQGKVKVLDDQTCTSKNQYAPERRVLAETKGQLSPDLVGLHPQLVLKFGDLDVF